MNKKKLKTINGGLTKRIRYIPLIEVRVTSRAGLYSSDLERTNEQKVKTFFLVRNHCVNFTIQKHCFPQHRVAKQPVSNRLLNLATTQEVKGTS